MELARLKVGGRILMIGRLMGRRSAVLRFLLFRIIGILCRSRRIVVVGMFVILSMFPWIMFGLL